MATEDFTTYTEDDTPARLTVTTSKVAASGLDGDEDCQVYSDKTAGHFGTTFEHLVTVTPQSETGAGDPHHAVWAVSNTLSNRSVWQASLEQALFCGFRQDSDEIRFMECEAGTTDIYDYLSDFNGITFYLTAERTGDTTATLKIYSDAARTTLLDTLLQNVPSGRSYRYIWGFNSNNAAAATGQIAAIDVENLDLQEAAAGTNIQINIGDAWKTVPAIQINIGDAWKNVVSASVNIGDAWKTIF